MEQGQENAAMATPEKVVVAEPVQPKNNKNKVGMIVGIVCLVILAATGLSFGAYAMITKDAAVAEAVASCATNKPTDALDDINGTACSDGAVVDVLPYKNPVIISNESGTHYIVPFVSSNAYEDAISREIVLYIENGAIRQCLLNDRDDRDGQYFSQAKCGVNGLSGKIFKAVEIGAGQDNLYSKVGFIMEDGSVYYFSLYDVFNDDGNFNFSVKKLNIDGFVTDAVEIGVGFDDAGGGGSTAFVLRDGSVVLYDENML